MHFLGIAVLAITIAAPFIVIAFLIRKKIFTPWAGFLLYPAFFFAFAIAVLKAHDAGLDFLGYAVPVVKDIMRHTLYVPIICSPIALIIMRLVVTREVIQEYRDFKSKNKH